MMLFAIIFTALVALSVCMTVAQIDKPRKPITRGEAIANLVLSAGLVAYVWVWAL